MDPLLATQFAPTRRHPLGVKIPPRLMYVTTQLPALFGGQTLTATARFCLVR
jgi:hypothetical protein